MRRGLRILFIYGGLNIQIKKVVMELKISQGYRVPWYLGYTYRPFDVNATFFHIIPLNFIIRFFRHIKYLWDKFRMNRSIIDRQIEKVKHKNYMDLQERFNEMVKFEARQLLEKQFEIYMKERKVV